MQRNSCFGVTYRLHLQGRQVSQVLNQHEEGSQRSASCVLHVGFLLGLLFSDPEDGGVLTPERLLTFTGPHGVISQMIEHFSHTTFPASPPVH
jgi:hypothetical protein